VNPRLHYVFPIEEEAYLQKGFKLKFDSDFRLVEYSPIPDMPQRQMRPTALLVNN